MKNKFDLGEIFQQSERAFSHSEIVYRKGVSQKLDLSKLPITLGILSCFSLIILSSSNQKLHESFISFAFVQFDELRELVQLISSHFN